MWPPQHRCSDCGATRLDWVDVAADGAIFSWTRTWYPFMPARADDLPSTTVVVELPTAGWARVLGGYAGAAEDLAVGRRVHGHVAVPHPSTLGLPSLVWEIDR
jgi:uncharacterized OB-fold protein